MLATLKILKIWKTFDWEKHYSQINIAVAFILNIINCFIQLYSNLYDIKIYNDIGNVMVKKIQPLP